MTITLTNLVRVLTRTPTPVLEELFRQYSGKLRHHLLRKTNDPELAADLAQEAFARIARMDGLERIANRPSYLFRTANNLLVDHLRTARERTTAVTAPETLEYVEDQRDGPESLAQREVDMAKLRAILLALPPRTRAVFQLCRLQERTHEEAAAHLGMSVSAVQKNLARALAAITSTLGDARP
ncbi:RNA polymerase sigma factor [Alcanivorax sp. S71-1-4]|uniref:RNA polymerase sigma factor n=1 Tax=Alcanivorax sp. S71-1-4 TaxID=1177159 RepID=UPI00135CBF46|nr:RNA polymerase sigma factor [Alcanivorax sp. S71-1-4]